MAVEMPVIGDLFVLVGVAGEETKAGLVGEELEADKAGSVCFAKELSVTVVGLLAV